MIDLEKKALDVLSKVSMCLGSSDKRFYRDIQWQVEHEPEKNLTRNQALFLWLLIYHYRRQLWGIDYSELLKHGTYVKQTGLLPDFYADYVFREPDEKPYSGIVLKTLANEKTRLEKELERGGGRLKL